MENEREWKPAYVVEGISENTPDSAIVRNDNTSLNKTTESSPAESKEEVKPLIFTSVLKKSFSKTLETFLETPPHIQSHFIQEVLTASYGLNLRPEAGATFKEIPFTLDGVRFTYKFDPSHKKFAEGVRLTNSKDQVASVGILHEFSELLYDRKVKMILKCLDKFTIKELLPKITNLTDRKTAFIEEKRKWNSPHIEDGISETIQDSAIEINNNTSLDRTTESELKMDSYDKKELTETEYFNKFKIFLEEIKKKSFINTENKDDAEKKYIMGYQSVEFKWGGKKFIYTSNKNRDKKYIIDPKNITVAADNDDLSSLNDLKETIFKLHEFILSENPYGRLSLRPRKMSVEKTTSNNTESSLAESKEEVTPLIFKRAFKKPFSKTLETFLETPPYIQSHFIQEVLTASYGLNLRPEAGATFKEIPFTLDGVRFTYKFEPKHISFAEGVQLINSKDQVASVGILNKFSELLYDRKVKAILQCLNKFTIKELLPKITNPTNSNTAFKETLTATPERKAYIQMQKYIDQKKELERVIALDKKGIINEKEILDQNTPTSILEALIDLRKKLEPKLSVILEQLPDLLQEFHTIRADSFHSRNVETTIAIIKDTIKNLNSYDLKSIKNFTTVMEQFLISPTINLVEPSPANNPPPLNEIINKNISKSITLLKAISEKCEEFSKSYPNQKIIESLRSYDIHKEYIKILEAEQFEHELQLETTNQQLDRLKLLTSV